MSEPGNEQRTCEAEDCEEPAVEVHIPVEGAVEYEPHDLCEEHAAMTNNKVRDIPRTDGGTDHDDECPKCGTGVKFLDGAGPYCPSCEWRVDDKPRFRADGGSERPRCPNCGEAGGTRYETGESGPAEFDCENRNCRCEVFRAPEDWDDGLRADGGERMWTVRWLGETHRMTDSQLDAILQAKLDKARGSKRD